MSDHNGNLDPNFSLVSEAGITYRMSNEFDTNGGWQTLIIAGFPTGTNYVVANVVSDPSLPYPNADHNTVALYSAQLFDNGKKCRVRITVDHLTNPTIKYRIAFVYATLG